jgi:hypothetical protein
VRHSAQTDLIDAAMGLVQASLELVQKNKAVDVDGAKAKWQSKFATFDVLYMACRDALRKEGVTIYQGGSHMQSGGERLVTRLAKGGQWIESDFPIKASRDGAQGFGGGISFAKRWGLMGMVGLVSSDDPDEKAGYQDERARPKKQAAPAGLPAALESIRSAETYQEFAMRVSTARASNPTGDGSVAVEQAVEAWLCDELQRMRGPGDLDALTMLRDLCNRVRPRGTKVRTQIGEAEKRIGVPQ